MRAPLLMAPVYAGNMAAPFARVLPGVPRPISERWLGSHKTWRGLLLPMTMAHRATSRLRWRNGTCGIASKNDHSPARIFMSSPLPTAAPVETPPSLDAKLQFLRSPAAHGATRCDVEVVETHMSWVFLAGDRVLKLKKPVRFPFLDFSTIAERELNCGEELRLNRRLAPGVYLGLLALQWHGGEFSLLPPERLPAPGRTVDWLVLMRRLPEQRMLHRLIAQGQIAPADIDKLVVLLGHFYRHAMTLPVQADEYVARFHREQASNREVMLRP